MAVIIANFFLMYLGSDFCYAFDVNIDFKTHFWTVQGNVVNSALQWRSP
jgi:hypothetical protein